jgi:hypothetical protein
MIHNKELERTDDRRKSSELWQFDFSILYCSQIVFKIDLSQKSTGKSADYLLCFKHKF